MVWFFQSSENATAVSKVGPAPDHMQSPQMMLPSTGDHPAQDSGHSATHSKKVLVELGITECLKVSNLPCVWIYTKLGHSELGKRKNTGSKGFGGNKKQKAERIRLD